MDWEQLLHDCVGFTQRLIQTKSISYEERELARLVADELCLLQFDEVRLDGIGNVIGRLYGQNRELPAPVLNTHLDHVDPGEPSLWSVPPYSGMIVDGRIIGRGASDIKGPLAVQVYSMAALRRSGERPLRDVVFTGVVQEEVGGEGAIHWVENLDYPVELVVLGEPSNNSISLGHRGGCWLWVKFYGRSAHASVPDKGVNPNWALTEFLHRLNAAKDSLQTHPLLGATTVTPTILKVDTTSQNVIPAWTMVMLDIRTAAESMNSLLAFIRRLIGDWPHDILDPFAPGGEAPPAPSDETIFGFYTPPESPVVARARGAIERGLGEEAPFSSYQFATDGRHFVPYNLPMIGFAAGEEEQAHVVDESISIAKMEASLRAHVQLLREF